MKYLIEMYLDYVNSFLTVEKFAEYYDLEKQDAFILIDLGRKYHRLKVESYG